MRSPTVSVTNLVRQIAEEIVEKRLADFKAAQEGFRQKAFDNMQERIDVLKAEMTNWIL